MVQKRTRRQPTASRPTATCTHFVSPQTAQNYTQPASTSWKRGRWCHDAKSKRCQSPSCVRDNQKSAPNGIGRLFRGEFSISLGCVTLGEQTRGFLEFDGL